MLNLQKYLQSGIIETHFLGTATPEESKELLEHCKSYPEVKKYYDKTEQALEYYLKSMEVEFPPEKKAAIWKEILKQARKEHTVTIQQGRLTHYIDISQSESFPQLQSLLQDIHPPAVYDNIHLQNIYTNAGKELNLVWVKYQVPLEEHPHLDETQ